MDIVETVEDEVKAGFEALANVVEQVLSHLPISEGDKAGLVAMLEAARDKVVGSVQTTVGTAGPVIAAVADQAINTAETVVEKAADEAVETATAKIPMVGHMVALSIEHLAHELIERFGGSIEAAIGALVTAKNNPPPEPPAVPQ